MYKLIKQILTLKIFIILITLPCCSNSTANGDDKNNDNKDPQDNELIDALATKSTKTLYKNLSKAAQKGIIIGQQEAYMENNDKKYQTFCDISTATGEYPLLAGGDIETLTNDSYSESSWRQKRVNNMVEWIKECNKNGVFVTLSWHFREPFYGDHFYVTDMDKNDPNSSKAAFKSILEGGVNHTYYKKKLALLADFFKSLKDENGELIPIIFRPFHEFGGKWFWWGVPYYATPEEFIKNWQFTIDFLKNDCNVHNLIYAFTPGFNSEEEYLNSYPGDEYVDIFGFDSYTSKNVANESSRESEANEIINQLNIISSLAKKRNKIAAFTEFGHDIIDKTKIVDDVYTKFYLEILNKIDGNIAYMMTWYNSDKHFTPLSEDASYINDFKKFIYSDAILTQGEISSPLIP